MVALRNVGRAARPAVVLAVAAGVESMLLVMAHGAWRSLVETSPGALPADRAGGLLVLVLVLAAAGAWTQWCLVLLLTATARAGGAQARFAVRIAPAAWRASATACLGLAVTVPGTSTTSTASTAAILGTAVAAGVAADDEWAGRLDGLPLPDRPIGGVRQRVRAGPAGAAVVTVRTGDTLWGIAASTVPAAATDARVDHTWRAWYAANRRTVGPDPDLLLPGQHLTPPDPTEETPK